MSPQEIIDTHTQMVQHTRDLVLWAIEMGDPKAGTLTLQVGRIRMADHEAEIVRLTLKMEAAGMPPWL